MTQPSEWNQEKLTSKLKSARKKIRQLESDLDSERGARKSLEERVDRIDNIQENLMFTLRNVLKKLDMKPSRRTDDKAEKA